jgi:hypothetical protein
MEGLTLLVVDRYNVGTQATGDGFRKVCCPDGYAAAPCLVRNNLGLLAARFAWPARVARNPTLRRRPNVRRLGQIGSRRFG